MTEFDQAAWRRSQAQQAAADRRLAAKLRALDAKKNGGGGGGRRGGGGGDGGSKNARARATRGAGSWAGGVPALLLKIHAGGRYGDRYSERQKGAGAEFIDSNMLGRDAGERAAEFDLDAARHPRVNKQNLFVHLSLSRPARADLTPVQWQKVAQKFLKEIGADGCNFVATRHTSTPHDHLHLTFSRARPDGSLVSMSQNRWRWREAVRQVETQLGITAVERPADVNRNRPVAATSDAQINAGRRAQRRGTPPAHIDPAVIARALATASTPEQFAASLEVAGILVKAAVKNCKTTGILFQKKGAEEWLAGSSIGREFSLPKVQAQIELNRQALLKKDRDLVMRQHQELQQRQAAQRTTYDRPRGG